MSATIKIELTSTHLVLPNEFCYQYPYSLSGNSSSVSASMSQETPTSDPVSQPRHSISSSSSSSATASLPLAIGTTPVVESSSRSPNPGAVLTGCNNHANPKKPAGISLRLSRQQLRAQQLLIAPFPNPDQTTTVSPSIAMACGHFDTEHGLPSGISTLPGRSASQSRTARTDDLEPNQIAFPFEIQVPNHASVSILAPQGGTTYRLTAVLTIAKKHVRSSSTKSNVSAGECAISKPPKKNGTGGKGLMSTFFTLSPPTQALSIVTENCTVQICRAPHIRSPYFPTFAQPRTAHAQMPQGIGRQNIEALGEVTGSDSNPNSNYANTSTITNSAETGESEQHQYGAMIPGVLNHHWPECSMTATISLPYIHLPSMSNLDTNVRLEFLPTTNSVHTVKSLQLSLYERVIYRLSKRLPSSAFVPETDEDREDSDTIIVGIRDRVISTQHCPQICPESPENGQSNQSARLIERTFRFQVPNAVRASKELFSTRNCNPSTVYRVLPSERQQVIDRLSQQEDLNFDGAGGGRSTSLNSFQMIDIEIQHYIRSTLSIRRTNARSQETILERILGDIPVVVMGLVHGPMECDGTGLPSYLSSFSTSVLSIAESQLYEYETVISVAAASIRSARSSTSGDGTGSEPMYAFGPNVDRANEVARDGNDDALLSILGLQSRSLPRLPGYEESILSNSTRPSLDTTFQDLTIPDH
ncbi:hypothetical protein BGW38_005907 [Lunasporangiospora selenospora]|uniref:Uncharacterized protein n=1 Tax=Lunasporangiospora selenospora TaxID=979761 RepID=A0A9P6KH72_9FUNG|nr:hypothetical protein BGW38_005907 [Lunasporangiospora selenospora]